MKFPMPALKAPKLPSRCVLLFILLSVAACTPATATTPPEPSPTTEQLPSPTVTPVPETPSLPLSEPGPYAVSKRRYEFYDASRENRKVSITVWYPALQPEDAEQTSRTVTMETDPDLNGAPYPLLISSTEMANTMAKYVVSHGFVWVSVNGIHSYSRLNEQMYSQPLDILFALDGAAAGPLEGLDGVIDADRTGVIGYSFDGYNTLAMSGARVDPAFYLSLCEKPDAGPDWLHSDFCAFSCEPALEWELFTTHIPEAITSSDGGLWQPMTDERIRAVMPMAAEGWWFFGEKGLGAIERPVMMLTGTEDELYPQNALIYEHINSPDKTFISFVGYEHMMVFINKQIIRMAHFAVAFFGHHLQGHTEYAYFYSKEFINQFDDIAWGIHKE